MNILKEIDPKWEVECCFLLEFEIGLSKYLLRDGSGELKDLSWGLNRIFWIPNYGERCALDYLLYNLRAALLDIYCTSFERYEVGGLLWDLFWMCGLDLSEYRQSAISVRIEDHRLYAYMGWEVCDRWL